MSVSEPASSFGIRLLGQPRFTLSGEPYRLSGPPRMLALLVYLVLHETAIGRDALAFTLWPDEPEEAARANLRRHIYRLNGALPPPAGGRAWIISDAESIGWNRAAGATVDVAEFGALVADPASRERAVDMYAGDLCEGLYDDWIFAPRERLRADYLYALERLTIERRSARDFSRAAAFAERMLRADEWREDIVRQLMAIRYESGDRAGALHVGNAFAQRLREAMNVDVMPETAALRNVILRNGALPAAGTSEPGGAERQSVPDVAFAGREIELETLRTAWQRAARGRGTLVLIGGEAGIGKTRLAREVCLLAESQGARTLCGTTTAVEAVPYQAIAQALRDAAPVIAGLAIGPVWLAAVAQLVPEVGQHQSEPARLPPLDVQRAQLRLFEGIVATLRALAQSRPVVLVLEDLQWAGPATLEALAYLARRVGGSAVLLLVTYRTDEAAHGIRRLRRSLALEGAIGHVALGSLPRAAAEQLARSVAAGTGQVPELHPSVYEASGGNPLFLIELLRDLRAAPGATAIPRRLRDVIGARVAQLSERGRLAAQVASAAGPVLDLDVLGSVTGWDEAEILAAMDELIERHLLREVAGPRFAFAFTHQLVAAAVYETIDAAARRRWHRRIASVIERLYADAHEELASELARQYDRGGDAARAAPFYLSAGRRAGAIAANEDALALLGRGIEIVTDVSVRFRLLIARETVLARCGRRAAQDADLEQLRRIVGERRAEIDDELVCDLLVREIRAARTCNDREREGRAIDELAARAAASGSVRRQADALAARGQWLGAAYRYDEAAAAIGEARALHHAANHPDGEIAALCALAELEVMRGSGADIRPYLAAAEALGDAQPNRALIARATMAGAGAQLMRREFAACRELAAAALERYRELGDREGEADALARLATALSMLGAFDEARAMYATAAEIFDRIGKRGALGYLLFNSSAASLQQGLLDEARASLQQASAIFEALDDQRGSTVCLVNRSMIELLAGDAPRAKTLARTALDSARRLPSDVIEAGALSNIGNAERDLGDCAAALEHMAEAIAIRARMGSAATFEELADFALAQLAAGDGAAARGTVESMLTSAADSAHNTIWPHYCYWAAARVHAATGSAAQARQLVERAYAIMRDLRESIADPRARDAFAALPHSRAIVAAYEHDRWPDEDAGRAASGRRRSP